jgi:hypothetical protein
LRNLILGAIALIVVLALALAWWLRDPNRLKPQLEAVLTDQTGYPIAIEGDLSWSLFPPVTLTAHSIVTDLDGDRLHIGSLALDVALMSLLRERRAPEDWEIRSVTVAEASLASGTDTINVERLDMERLRLGAAVPFTTRLEYVTADEPPMPMAASGVVTLHDDQRVVLKDFAFELPELSGLCDIDATPAAASWPAMQESDDDLIPASALRDWNSDVDCRIDRLELDGERLADVHLTAVVNDAIAGIDITVPRIFGGSAHTAMRIDAQGPHLAWHVEPELEGVDSQALMAWLDQSLEWRAPLAWRGSFELTGNTEAELTKSLRGASRFDGATGTLDISKLKSAALRLAAITGDADKVERWPNPLSYRRFTGDWRIAGRHQVLDLALDNLTLAAEGDYNPNDNAADLLAHITITSEAEYATFDIDDLLVDLPMPVRCKGILDEIACAADEAATRRMLANALGDERFRGKLDKTIDEKVPEEYRDAARSLLDLLGNKPEPKQD